MKISMVLTSHDQLGNTGLPSGFWLEEFADPYFVFREVFFAGNAWAQEERGTK